MTRDLPGLDAPIRVQYPAYEYLLRHIDDLPNIAFCRYQLDIVRKVSETAIGFALVGEVDGATKLLEVLVSRSINPFAPSEYPFLKPCMFFAWEATSSWPSWIPEDERTEQSLQLLETLGREQWLQRFKPAWSIDEETAEKALQLSHNSEFATDALGPFYARLSLINLWYLQHRFPVPWAQLCHAAGDTIAFDIYLRLGNLEKAHEVLVGACERFTFTEQAEMLSNSRIGWQKMFTKPDNPIRGLLEIHPAKMRGAIARSISMLESRLENGPERPFGKKSIEELVHIISKNTYENCPYLHLAAYGPRREEPKDKNGLLHPPASDSAIKALESKFESVAPLPQDYKDFLRVTNGMEPIWTGRHALRLLGKIDDVQSRQIDFMKGNEFNLTRQRDPPVYTGNSIDWLEISNVLQLNPIPGGYEGDLWLVDPERTKLLKACFFEAYDKRNEEQRKELERVVAETYGDMDTFRKLEWAVISWANWDVPIVPYRSFRDFLERLAENSLTKPRLWSHIFEPKYFRNDWEPTQYPSILKEEGIGLETKPCFEEHVGMPGQSLVNKINWSETE